MAYHPFKTLPIAALMAGLSWTAQAETLTLWGGSPELEPFYKYVAGQMKIAHPDFELKVETISLREHEKRLAFALPAGSAADIVEMQSEAPRYVQSGLLAPAPDKVAAFVKDPKTSTPSIPPPCRMASISMACRFITDRLHSITMPKNSPRPVFPARRRRWSNIPNMPQS